MKVARTVWGGENLEINSKGYLSPFAVTRPKKNLYITFPATINGKPSKRSRFLKEINLLFNKVNKEG
jgi:hypothetical protein